MNSRRQSLAFVPFLLLPFLLLTGCYGRVAGSSLVSIPPSGQVRIVPKRIVEDANTLDWEWTIIGDRNWRRVTQKNDHWTLDSSYPLNSTTETGGTHIYVFSLVIKKTRGTNTTAITTSVLLRGSNAGSLYTTDKQGPAAGDRDLNTSVLLKEGTTRDLPATVTLAKVGNRSIDLTIRPTN